EKILDILEKLMADGEALNSYFLKDQIHLKYQEEIKKLADSSAKTRRTSNKLKQRGRGVLSSMLIIFLVISSLFVFNPVMMAQAEEAHQKYFALYEKYLHLHKDGLAVRAMFKGF